MPVLLGSRLRRRRLRLSALQSLAEKILKATGSARTELSLMLVGAQSMRRLNRMYRHKDRITDVLAFPRRSTGRSMTRVLGDVVIALPQAERQARAAGHALEREMAMLMVHGVLHLLGYDHERSRVEACRMQRREHRVLRSLGRLPRIFPGT